MKSLLKWLWMWTQEGKLLGEKSYMNSVPRENAKNSSGIAMVKPEGSVGGSSKSILFDFSFQISPAKKVTSQNRKWNGWEWETVGKKRKSKTWQLVFSLTWTRGYAQEPRKVEGDKEILAFVSWEDQWQT